MKLIFAVLSVSRTMGLTRRYKMEGFFLPRCIYAGRSYHERNVCLSVCPSVWQTRELWQTERISPTFLYHV